jgi:Tfp pilus assembly protein PilP
MKLTTGILAVAMMTGAGWAQSPAAINQSNAAAGTSAQRTPSAKPTPGAPAPAVKPATIPGAKPAAPTKPASPAAAKPVVVPAKPAVPVKAAAKPSSASAAGQNNRLERVNVVRNADEIQIEISSREAVTPKVSKLKSPARVVVELPSTVMATPQNKIPVDSAGVKGVRIGMDGKTPPTTSVVVDLEQALGYELTPGPGNKFVLTLHTTQAVAKMIPAKVPANSSTPAPKPQIAASKPVAVPVTTQKVAVAAVPASTGKIVKIAPGAQVGAPKATTTVAADPKLATKPTAAAATKIVAKDNAPSVIKKVEASKPPTPEQKKWAMTGKRDPFFSPVVQQNGGSGCSTGKKCLEIGQINVRGVVKAESGFIAVVTNTLNKAYFLHENDPVFNGFVVRITGDSVVFQETMQDRLGKPFTREVVKRITTPAV